MKAVDAINTFEGLYFYVVVLFIVLGAGISEEIIFRGVVQDFLKEEIGVLKSITITSFVFALLHLSAIGDGIIDILAFMSVAFVLSFGFGLLYERTRNILVPIFLHSANNMIGVIVVLNTSIIVH